MIKEVPIREVASSLLNRFDCGNEPLNLYFSCYSKQNDRIGVGKTFVLMDDDFICGFYTLSSAQIMCNDMPDELLEHFPRYPLPAIRISRLAVDTRKQKQGIGSLLLKNAFKRILSISTQTGITFVIVDTKEESKGFYEHYGFICIDEDILTYVLPIQTLAKAALNL